MEREEGTVRRWIKEFEAAEKAEDTWQRQAMDTWLRYSQKKKGQKRSFNILWSNTQTTLPAVYSSTPLPDVRRRFRDQDRIARKVAEVLERTISFYWDKTGSDRKMRLASRDMLVPGRGVMIVRYAPEFGPQMVRKDAFLSQEVEGEVPRAFDEDGKEIDFDDVQFPPEDALDEQPFFEREEEVKLSDDIVIERVRWRNFTPLPADEWSRSRGFRIKKRLTKQEAIEAFGKDLANKLTYDSPKSAEGGGQHEANKTKEAVDRAEIWEVHDRDGKRVLFIHPDYKEEPLKTIDDPTGIDGFYTMPEPLYFSSPADDLVPLIPYSFYKDQAEELNDVTVRIGRIIRQLQAKGVYDKALMGDLANLNEAEDGELVPAEGGTERKLADAISWWPVEVLQQVLQSLLIAREQLKQTIFEITGLSDIVRGATKASETLGAQQIKAQFGSLRLDDLKSEVQRFARDLFNIMAQIIARNFDQESLQRITGVEMAPEEWAAVMEVLRSPDFLSFRIEVETDSTVAPRINEERQEITALLTAVSQYFQSVGPLSERAGGPIPDEVVIKMLLTSVRRFRLGRVIEDELESLLPGSGRQQQPRQDPEKEQAQAEAQANLQMKQLELQAKQQEAQQKQAQAAQEARVSQLKAQLEMQQLTMEAERSRTEHEQTMEAMRFKHQATMREIGAKSESTASA